MLKMPKLAGRIKQEGEWDDASLWGDTASKEFMFIVDLLTGFRTEFFAVVCTCHARVVDAAHRYFGHHCVEAPAEFNPYMDVTSPSPAIAHFHPPSGMRLE